MYLHKNAPIAAGHADYLTVFLQFLLPYAMSIFKNIIWELPVISTSLRYHSHGTSLWKAEGDNEQHQEEMEPK